MSSSTTANTFRNDSRATSIPRSFWSFWNVFIASNFPFVAAEEGRQWARRFVDVYGEAQSFLEPLSCAHKEERQSRAGGGVGDEGGDRTKEGSGFPLSRVWRRDRDRSGPTRSDGLGGWTPIFFFFWFLVYFVRVINSCYTLPILWGITGRGAEGLNSWVLWIKGDERWVPSFVNWEDRGGGDPFINSHQQHPVPWGSPNHWALSWTSSFFVGWGFCRNGVV